MCNTKCIYKLIALCLSNKIYTVYNEYTHTYMIFLPMSDEVFHILPLSEYTHTYKIFLPMSDEVFHLLPLSESS